MSNTISCPSCNRPLRVPETLLGQLVKCPTCGETFTAALDGPAREEAEPPRQREAPPERDREEEAPRRSSRRDEDDDRRRVSRRDDDDEDRPRRSRRDEEDEDEGRPRRRRRHLAEHRGPMIMTFGIISFFFMPVVFGPLAWILGSNDLKEMRAGRMDPEGEGQTQTGRLCGMISTILFGVIIVGCCSVYAIIAIGAAGSSAVR